MTMLVGAIRSHALVPVVVLILAGRPGAAPAAEPAPPREAKVKVAGIVLKWIRTDKDANFRRVEPLIREAAKNGAKIVCTTECFLDGYAIADKSIPLEDYRRLGEPIPKGAYYERLTALAGELKIHLIAGLLEADGEERYNTAVLIGPDGKLIGKYRKQKLGHESVRNTPGNSSSVFETPYGSVGIMICADRTDPALVRGFCANGADFLICPSGGMFGPKSNDPIVQERSRENKIPIVFVHPAEFLVTGPDGSILDRTILGDALLISKDQAGGDKDQNQVFYFELPVRKKPAGVPAKPQAAEKPVRLRGEVVDADTGKSVPSRVYIQAEDGTWLFPRSEASGGSAVPYRKQRADNPKCVEMHTTLSAHPFVIDLPPGRYTITAERGKEYLPQTQQVNVGAEPASVKFKLQRWINMQERGWYSGDTHVHRSLDELPNVMLAEDLNVAFPLLYWVTEAFVSPKASPRGPLGDVDAKAIPVDATHVIYPRNTEYEIFTVDKKRHTLGAFFVLNHQTVLDQGVPPVRAIAEQAHKEGGLIELDKHNWPWSMALVPVMQPDLYELANNHVWRTEFGFPAFGEPASDYMRVERTETGFTEWGWIDYGFQNYYALLNCGFRLRPTAGTASGVHPVPLGFGRVYVHCTDGFSYDAWLRGLNQGRSFVTTGPMLFVKVNDQEPGHTFQEKEPGTKEYRVSGSVLSEQPLGRIELIVNGEVARTLKPSNQKTERQAYENRFDEKLPIDGSAWIAVRCFEDRPDKRVRFVHSSPFHIDMAGKPLRPRRAEVEFLIKRVEDQITRSADLLPEAARAEYREALRVYQKMTNDAR